MLRRTVCRFHFARPALQFPALYGFELTGTHRVDELNLVAYQMRHAATGASYFHIDIDDSNNTFCIGFRTPAEDNMGTSHVLEHTTLCGSSRYPIRDPFFMMLKRSLSNFMNAMTGADYTLYPFATTNRQDFNHLLNVYLDAVFQPLLREEDFRQEGHRVEVERSPHHMSNGGSAVDGTAEAPAAAAHAGRRMIHNGVVFNEMRGVVSEPNHHFTRALMRETLPDTHYTFESGGSPLDILKLTYEDLVSFHRRHYHPSNSITFTYGNQHPAAHMKLMSDYFGRFERTDPVLVPTLRDDSRFREPKVVNLEGPLDAMGNPGRQKRISVAFGVPQKFNGLEDMVRLSVLDSLLSSGPSSPMYKALIESQIGSKYAPMRGYAYYLSSPIISYGVSGVDESREQTEREVLQSVVGALQGTCDSGFDERRVRSVVFQEELQQRHRAADYGVNLCTGLCAMGLCRTGNNPLDFINWLPHLRQLRDEKAASLLPLISTVLLNNPHRAVVSVSASKDYLHRLRDDLKKTDDSLNVGATPETYDRVEKESAAWLERVRTPQPTDVLPTLHVSDIPPKAFAEPLPRPCEKDENISTIGYRTNGLVYVHGIVPFATELASAATDGPLSRVSSNVPVLQTLLTRTGAGGMSYKEQSVETDLVCGGFSLAPVLNESYAARETTIAGTTFGFYTTKEKLEEALGLLALSLLEPRASLSDDDVYRRTLSQVKAGATGAIQGLQHQGNRIAVSSAVSRLTRRGAIQELWWGLAQARHASTLLEQLQSTEDAARVTVSALLAEYKAMTAAISLAMRGATLWATCEEEHREEVAALLCRFKSQFPTCPASLALTPRLRLPATALTPGLQVATEQLPIDTSFVGFAIPNELTWGHPHQAAVRVASVLLSNEYLHQRVREEGGAYGSGASATLQGAVGGITMSSYRDPTPQQSIQTFTAAAAWLSEPSNVTAARIGEAKLRLFSGIDAPYAADSYGEGFFLNDIDPGMKQRMREELLQVSEADVRDVAGYFAATEGKSAVACVLEPLAADEAM